LSKGYEVNGYDGRDVKGNLGEGDGDKGILWGRGRDIFVEKRNRLFRWRRKE
jgi:hypothetical protein